MSLGIGPLRRPKGFGFHRRQKHNNAPTEKLIITENDANIITENNVNLATES